MAKQKPPLLSLAVKFGNVSIGDKTASLKASTKRPGLSLAVADKNLCEKRLTGRLTLGAAEQGTIPGLDGNERIVNGIFDVKGVSFSRKTVSFGLTFMIEEIDIDTLAHFAQHEGVVDVLDIGDIPDEVPAAKVANGKKDGEEEE